METRKAIIVASPSGGGKGNVVKKLLKRFDFLELSISATTREPGPGEVDGKDYYFISLEEFLKGIANDDFLEYQEVYKGFFYGTRNIVVSNIWESKKIPLFDIDIYGALRIREILGNRAIIIFLHPGEPAIEILRERLVKRGRDSEEKIEKRLRKAPEEITMGRSADHVVVNENGKFDETINTIADIIESFLSEKIKN